jgi:dephospho-CoA kinase
LLGEDIFENGFLRKDIMASRIFSDKSLLAEVNKLVHPKVLDDFLIWRTEREERGDPLVVLESAIYFETSLFHFVADVVVVVSAPEEIRIKRVMERDGIPEHRVRERMAVQCSEEERLSGADFVIFADGNRAVLPQAYNLLSMYGYFDKTR